MLPGLRRRADRIGGADRGDQTRVVHMVLGPQLRPDVRVQEVPQHRAQVRVQLGEHIVVRGGDHREMQRRVRLDEGVRVPGVPGPLAPLQQRVEVPQLLLPRRSAASAAAVASSEPRSSATCSGSASANLRCITPASSLVATTYVPEPCRMSSSPLCASARTASRTVLRATPSRSTSSGSVGMRKPTGQAPEVISARSRAMT